MLSILPHAVLTLTLLAPVPATINRLPRTTLICATEAGTDAVAAHNNLPGVTEKSVAPPPLPQHMSGGVAAATASLSVWMLSSRLGVVPATALVGTLGGTSLLAPSWRLPFFCGAFVGMSSRSVLASAASAVLAGWFAGGVTLPLLDGHSGGGAAFQGCGGRLGFAAMLTSIAAWASLCLWRGTLFAGAATLIAAPPMPISWSASILGPLIGALGTKLWMDTMARPWTNGTERLANSVTASSAVTGLACLLGCSPPWQAPIFTGSFVAMSAPKVLATYQELAGASLAAALAHILLAGCLAHGFGGRLGFSALVGVLSYSRLRQYSCDLGMPPRDEYGS